MSPGSASPLFRSPFLHLETRCHPSCVPTLKLWSFDDVFAGYPQCLPWLSPAGCPGGMAASQGMSIWSWQYFCRPCRSLTQEPGLVATAAKPRALPVPSRCQEEHGGHGTSHFWLETDNGNGHLGGFEWLVNRGKSRFIFHLSVLSLVFLLVQIVLCCF